MKNKGRVSVIGGAGFIGRYVAERLHNEGYSVSVLDLSGSGLEPDKYEVVKADILDRDALHECIEGSEYVYNFAGIKAASVSPVKTIETNVMGSVYVLDEVVKSNVSKYLFASSMYVYSGHGGFYRASKQASEEIIAAYNEKYSIDYVLLRYGTLYGPGAQTWNSMRRYIEQIMKTGLVDYVGTGDEIREYIHVKDAAELSVQALSPKYSNCGLNVTGSQVMHSIEMLNMIGEILGKEVKIRLINDDPDHNHYVSTPYRYIPKAAKKIVPNEFIDIGHGILEMIHELDMEHSSH